MTLKLYNTMSRKKQVFKPLKEKEVGLYTCGPTVYWFAHVGNFRAYIFADTLKRVLEFNGYKVNHVINVTDVGHLTSDADEGEDKLERAASKEGKTAEEISHFYFEAFHQDFEKLQLEEPSKWVWATKHISEQIKMIEILEEKGYTYKTSDGIYFDSSKFNDYGKLSKKNIKELQGGKRINLGEKKNKTDFALWKFSEEPGKRQQEWESPWGLGFPGWHIECSAMSSKYLGKQFDIHTGGEDHIPVHHENEIAQSECAFGVHPWVNYWMHNAFLQIPGGKMSKSSGKIQTISQLEEKGFSAFDYKYFIYSAHYRKPLTWTMEGLESAKKGLNKLRKQISEIKDDGKKNEKVLEDFKKAINDDLNMPNALAILHKLVSDENAEGKYQTIKEMDKVFALDLFNYEEKKIEVPLKIKELAEKRIKAREEKNWKESDRLRDEITDNGYEIIDTKEGYEINKK